MVGEFKQVLIGVALLVLGVLWGICQTGDMVEQVPTMLDSVVVDGFKGKKISSLCVRKGEEGKVAEQVDIREYSLRIKGSAGDEREYSYDEVVAFDRYKKVVTLRSETWRETVELEGVLVGELIGDAGVLPGAKNVIIRAMDGYEASFSLDHIVNNGILFAFRINGKPLTAEGGYPFILAAETVRGQEWVKWVAEIEVKDDK
jgi:DMSO/TMAO reductase YedYZ molybdopterin-dependent catalytic subunit